MFATVLIAAFALASVATVLVLADSGLRWWSAFGLLRQRIKSGYATAGIGQRPSIIGGEAIGFGRQSRVYPVIRQDARRAA